MEILTDSNNQRRYWSDVKRKMEKEGFIRNHTQNILLKCDDADQVIDLMKKYKNGGNLDLAVT